MPCTPIRHGSISGVACGPRRRAAPCDVPGCERPHVALCDYQLAAPPLDSGSCPASNKPRTCDLKLCERHRWPVPGKVDTDLCPAHRLHAERQRNQCVLNSVGGESRRGIPHAH